MTNVRTMVNLIISHAKLYWTCDDDAISAIFMKKFDAALDFSGSFLEKLNSPAYGLIKDQL